MPALQIRDVPEDVYQDLVALAKKEHRSINQQALFMLREKMSVTPSFLDSERKCIGGALGVDKFAYGLAQFLCYNC